VRGPERRKLHQIQYRRYSSTNLRSGPGLKASERRNGSGARAGSLSTAVALTGYRRDAERFGSRGNRRRPSVAAFLRRRPQNSCVVLSHNIEWVTAGGVVLSLPYRVPAASSICHPPPPSPTPAVETIRAASFDDNGVRT